MNKIQEAIKTNDFAIGIFVDLQKAFDTVNHDILIEKLNYYGISGITNSWFKSYLNEKTTSKNKWYHLITNRDTSWRSSRICSRSAPVFDIHK